MHTWVSQHGAVSGWLSPRAAPPLQEPAESGQKSLTMPGTNSQGAAKDKSGILGAQALPEFRGWSESAWAAGSD